MKKILFIIQRFHYSGAAKAMQIIANELSKLNKYEICIASYCNTSPCYPVESNIKIMKGNHDFDIRGVKGKVNSLKNTYRIINEYNPDIIIAFANNSSFYSILSTLFKDNKVVVCERCDPYNENRLSLRFMRFFFRFAEGAVFQTEGARKYYKTLYKKSIVIPNIVDDKYRDYTIKPFKDRNDEINIFSRIEIKQKRHDILIKAFNEIHKKYPKIIMNIYGDGPDEDKIKALVKDYKIDDCVNFKGPTDKALSILANSKFTILSSDYEGIPNGVIDAMSIGIPVIATDTSPGGVRLLIDDGRNGYIVPCGDYMKIAEKANYLMSNPDIGDQISRESRKIVDVFSKDSIVEKWEQYLDMLIIN